MSTNFKEELTHLINRYSLENGSDTPDFMLAEYLVSCLNAYERAVEQRSAWFGNKPIEVTIGNASQVYINVKELCEAIESFKKHENRRTL
jgi:hypothetical protein